MIWSPDRKPASSLAAVARTPSRRPPWIVSAVLILAASLPAQLLAASDDADGDGSFGLLQPQAVLSTFGEPEDVLTGVQPVFTRSFLAPMVDGVVQVNDEVDQPPPPPSPAGTAGPPASAAPSGEGVAPPPAMPATAPPANFLSTSIGTASTAQSTAPFMIGDAFGGTNVVINGLPGQASLGPIGGSLNVTGRLKLGEGFSPMPRDRIFFDYNDFQNAPLLDNITVSDLNRYSPGFEKTFFDRWASIEVRLPVAQTLNSTISGISPNNTHQGEFGDLFVSFKTLLWQTDTVAVSTGLAMSLPTANSITLVNFPSVSLNQMQIQNRAVYFDPFIACLWTPNDRFYMQALFVPEVASYGSPVTLDFAGMAPQYLGRLNNQTTINFNFSAGYWIYRKPCARYVTAISPIFELHQSQTTSGSNLLAGTSARGDLVSIGQTGYVFQLLNCTTGVNVQMGPLSSLLVGYTTPLGSGSDKQFSGEFRVLFNRRFGPQNRLTRPQF